MTATVRDVGEVGSRVDTLSLADCYAHDSEPSKSLKHLRFLCPLHGGDQQKSMQVDEETGRFKCHNCQRWGTVTEHRSGGVAGGFGSGASGSFGASATGLGFGQPRDLPPLKDAQLIEVHEGAVKRIKYAFRQFKGSPAEEYARLRGIPDKLMKPHLLGYWQGEWGGEDSDFCTFPLRCPVTGLGVSIYGRNLLSDVQAKKGRILGKTGLFGAVEVGPMPEDVIVVEGVFEAMAILNSPGLPQPRAIIGVAAQAAWFDSCRRVIIMLDDDQAGQGATDRLVKEFQERKKRRGSGPQVLRLRPQSLRDKYGVKDLGELLKQGIQIKLPLPELP